MSYINSENNTDEKNSLLLSEETSEAPLCDKFLPLIEQAENIRDETTCDISRLSADLSMLQSTLINELKEIDENLQSMSKTVPQVKRAVNKSAPLPKLPLTMDSCQSMDSVIKNACGIFETASDLKHANLLSLENLEKSLKKKQQMVNQMNQKVSMFEDYFHTIQTLLDDMSTLRDLEKSRDTRPEIDMLSDNSSILTIRSEDVQGSSSVLEKSDALDLEDLPVSPK